MSQSNPYSLHRYPIAPEPMQRAMSRLLGHVIVVCRVRALDESFSRNELHDLMDAVHNIPAWMLGWDERRQPTELRNFLAGYEERWPANLKLVEMFDHYYWEESHHFWDEPTAHATKVIELSTNDDRRTPFTLTYWVVDNQFIGQTANRKGEVRIFSTRADSLDELKQQVIKTHTGWPIEGD